MFIFHNETIPLKIWANGVTRRILRTVANMMAVEVNLNKSHWSNA